MWQFVAGTQSVDAELTSSRLKHFAACVLCFYLGLFSLSRRRGSLAVLGRGCSAVLLLVLMVGWEQHFGGLQETRRYFYTYVYPR